MITVANINGSPASNPKLGFGFHSDDNFFYFFESKQEREDYIAQLNIGVPTPSEVKAEVNAALNTIFNIAQSAVGVRIQDLTQAQIKSLQACFLFKLGGLDTSNLTVKPLNQWLRQ